MRSVQMGKPLDLRSVIDSIPGLVVCALPDGTVESVNLGWQQYTGRSSDELTGWGWQNVIHPDDRSNFTDEWRVARAADTPFETEARVRRFDGQYRWFFISKLPLRDETNQINRWFGTGYDINDRKQADERLLQKEQELRTIIETIPAFVGTALSDGSVDFISQSWLDYTGLSREQWVDWGWTTVTHPEDVYGAVTKWKAALTTGKAVEHEQRVRQASGEYRWFLGRNVPLRDENGNIVKWYGTLHDIEDIKRAEVDLRRRDAYSVEAQRLSHAGSFGWKVLSGEIFWSEETYQIFECDRDVNPSLEFILQRVHPDDRARVQQILDQASEDGATFDVEYRLLMPDGRVKYLQVIARASRDSSGGIEIIGAVMDISKYRCADEKIREQEIEFRQILDATPQHVGVLRADQSRLYANRATLDYYGLTLLEWRSCDPRKSLHPDDLERLANEAQIKFSSGSAHEFESRLLRSDGKYRWFLIRLNPLRDDRGQITRWYVAATDVEDRKQAEERLRLENIALREEIAKSSMFDEI